MYWFCSLYRNCLLGYVKQEAISHHDKFGHRQSHTLWMSLLGCYHVCGASQKKKKNADPLLKVGVNKMPVRSTHDDMATRHAISGTGLLIPLEVDTIVTMYPSNQLRQVISVLL